MTEDTMITATAGSDRTSWARLIGDHDRIERQCFDLVALTEQPEFPCGLASRMLLDLAVLVADHLGVEDEVVDLAVIALEAEYSPDAIDRMTADLETLRADWKVFVSRWIPTIATQDRQQFASEASTILPRLSLQVHRETALLYDRALTHGIVKLGIAVRH